MSPEYNHPKIQAMERQGFGLHPNPKNTWKTTPGDTIRQKAVSDMQSTYPELDIQSTGKCEVWVREIKQIAQVKQARTEAHPIDTEIPIKHYKVCHSSTSLRCNKGLYIHPSWKM